MESVATLGKILLDDSELDKYYQQAIEGSVLSEKVRVVKEYLKKHNVFKYADLTAYIDHLNKDGYEFVKINSEEAFDSSKEYYIKLNNGRYFKIPLNENIFHPDENEYYEKHELDINAYESNITEVLSNEGLKKEYYGNLYNFLVSSLNKPILDRNRSQHKKRSLGMRNYLFRAKIGYEDNEKQFLSISEIYKEYSSKINLMREIRNSQEVNPLLPDEVSFLTTPFLDIYYNLILTKVDNPFVSNNRINKQYSLVSYGGYKNNIFEDYRDNLILASLNSAYNTFNDAMLEKEFDAFVMKMVLNMEKRYNNYLRDLRNSVDNNYNELVNAISLYNLFVNSTGTNETTEDSTIDLSKTNGSLNKLETDIGSNVGTYFSNLSKSASSLFESISDLYKAIGNLDYSDLKDNDLCAYLTYLEYMERLSSDGFTINTLDDMILAEFSLLLFRFFSKIDVYDENNPIGYPYACVNYATANDPSTLVYTRALSYEPLNMFFIENNGGYEQAETPSITEYTKFYRADSSDPNSYYIASEYSEDKEYYTFSTTSNNTAKYITKDGGLTYHIDEDGDSYRSATAATISNENPFTEYYYLTGADIIKVNSDNGPLIVYDKTENIEKTINYYGKIRQKLLDIFLDMDTFNDDIYERIYNEIKEDDRFDLDDISIYLS